MNRDVRHALATWIAPHLKRYRLQLSCALGLGIAAGAFACALMVTSGYLISASAARPDSILLLFMPLILVRVFGVGKPVMAYVERLASHDWVLRMTSSLRRRLYEALEHSASPSSRRSLGDALGMLAEDIGHLQNLYLRSAFPAIVGLSLYAAGCVVLGIVDAAAGAAFLVGCGVAAIAAPAVSLAASGPRERARKAARNELYRIQTDDVLGLEDWLCSGRREAFLRHGSNRADEAHAIERAGRRFDRRRDLAIQVAFGITACSLLAWAGVRFGGASASVSDAANWIAAFVLGLFPLMDEFSQLSPCLVEGAGHLDALGRLDALDTREDPDARDGKRREAPAPSSGDRRAYASGDTNGAPGAKPLGSAPRPESGRCDIHAAGLSFSYPAERPVLQGISLEIPAGQHVAVLGRSGAGKSTLAHLVRGALAPDAGELTVGGVRPSQLGPAASELIGVIQQDPYLFDTTLFDNLCVSRADATRDDALRALDRVGLSAMVQRLPNGLDTKVGEGGARFSGGERHRIALARALLRDTPIVLLDEPFAGLDPLNERQLLDVLLSAFDDKTLVVITHHLQDIERFDRVILLEDGRIAADGAPGELALGNERFARLLAFDRSF